MSLNQFFKNIGTDLHHWRANFLLNIISVNSAAHRLFHRLLKKTVNIFNRDFKPGAKKPERMRSIGNYHNF